VIPAAARGSRGALWRCRTGPTPTPGALDAGGLAGVVDGERGFVLARRLSGERALPTVGRAVLVSPARLCRHVLVCGATGSGKTETVLRLAWIVAKHTRAPVFYLDGKGDRDTARRFCALMQDAGRTTKSTGPMTIRSAHHLAFFGIRVLVVLRTTVDEPVTSPVSIRKPPHPRPCLIESVTGETAWGW
jgi:hypothetical protein